MEEKREHWISRVAGIKAKDIFELANSLDKISQEKFVVASQVYPNKEGYDALIYYKLSPEENINKELGINNKTISQKDKPTQKQLDFLREHKFKIEPNLTKQEAYSKISEYLSRVKKNNKREEYIDYEY